MVMFCAPLRNWCQSRLVELSSFARRPNVCDDMSPTSALIVLVTSQDTSGSPAPFQLQLPVAPGLFGFWNANDWFAISLFHQDVVLFQLGLWVESIAGVLYRLT